MTALSSRRSLIITVLILGAGAAGYVVWTGGGKARREALDAQDLLRGTDEATLTFFKLDPMTGLRPEGRKWGTLQDWTILQETVLRNPKDEEEIRDILTSSGTYADSAPRCFEPGMGFRFKNDVKQVNLVICLNCSWIYAFEGGRTLHLPLSARGVSRLMAFYKSHAEPQKS